MISCGVKSQLLPPPPTRTLKPTLCEKLYKNTQAGLLATSFLRQRAPSKDVVNGMKQINALPRAGAEAGVATHAHGTATSRNQVGGQAIDKRADANVSSQHATGALERPVKVLSYLSLSLDRTEPNSCILGRNSWNLKQDSIL